MPEIILPYGKKSFTLNMDDSRILTVVKANASDIPEASQDEAVLSALAHPIASPQLAEILKPDEKICLIAPDITRLWESTFVSTPILLDAINKCGIPDEDITILCACGTHRAMTEAEHEELLGKDVVKRARIIDHQCADGKDLKFMGKTSRGTEVYFNRHAAEADKIITLCGVVYHFLAGFGGGGKMLLPGIAGCETIQQNHELALNKGFGSGVNPEVRSGNLTSSNPFHADIVEAASLLPPAFAMNVVVNDKFHIIKAFAGDWKQSHIEACRLVEKIDGVKIPEKSDFVIASAGGAPKDINLYQGVKLLSNALAAARPGAAIILVAQFSEGFGNPDTKKMICGLKDMNSREKSLRENFSIGAFAGFLFAEAAEQYNLILVTEMPGHDFAATKAKVVSKLDDALHIAAKELPDDARAIIMPHGATTLPLPDKQ